MASFFIDKFSYKLIVDKLIILCYNNFEVKGSDKPLNKK